VAPSRPGAAGLPNLSLPVQAPSPPVAVSPLASNLCQVHSVPRAQQYLRRCLIASKKSPQRQASKLKHVKSCLPGRSGVTRPRGGPHVPLCYSAVQGSAENGLNARKVVTLGLHLREPLFATGKKKCQFIDFPSFWGLLERFQAHTGEGRLPFLRRSAVAAQKKGPPFIFF
jgi:hypothetical protein